MHNPLVPALDLEDEDFSDLDAIISDAEAKRHENKRIDAKQRRLAKGGLDENERFALLAEIRRYEDAHVWRTVAAVALFDTQICVSCGHTHRFFRGWMTAQDHKRDSHCRRLVRGKPIGNYPERVEEHAQGQVEMCDDCAEACLIINQVIKE